MKDEMKFSIGSYLVFTILLVFGISYFVGKSIDFSALFTLKNVLSYIAFLPIWYLLVMISKASHSERGEIRKVQALQDYQISQNK